MKTRSCVIPLSVERFGYNSEKQFLDLDTEKREEGDYLLMFSKRRVSTARQASLLSKLDLNVRMTKPEIQQLVSELTKILLFDE